MIKENQRGVNITNVIDGLRFFASYDYQKIGWFENNLGLCSAYNEDVDAIFRDTGLEVALDAGEVVFGKEADSALRELGQACDAIGYRRDHYELVESDEMKVVRQMARHCLDLIRTSEGKDSTVDLIEIDLMTTDHKFGDMPD